MPVGTLEALARMIFGSTFEYRLQKLPLCSSKSWIELDLASTRLAESDAFALLRVPERTVSFLSALLLSADWGK